MKKNKNKPEYVCNDCDWKGAENKLIHNEIHNDLFHCPNCNATDLLLLVDINNI